MKRLASFLVALGVLFAASAAAAQNPRTLDAFLTEANRIPLNAAAALRPSAHRLKTEAERAFRAVHGEIRTARAEGRTPPACPPERMEVNPRQLLNFLNAIPQARRQRMSLTDGIRSWMAARYPCSG
jgi:hypothetical protein